MDAHYIWFAFYEKCIKSLSVLLICLVNFQNRAAIKKKEVIMVSKHTLIQIEISLYPIS